MFLHDDFSPHYIFKVKFELSALSNGILGMEK